MINSTSLKNALTNEVYVDVIRGMLRDNEDQTYTYIQCYSREVHHRPKQSLLYILTFLQFTKYVTPYFPSVSLSIAAQQKTWS